VTATTDQLRTALDRCVDAMRRADTEYAASHDQPQTTDDEWDDALQAGEDALDAAALAGEEALIEAKLEDAA